MRLSPKLIGSSSPSKTIEQKVMSLLQTSKNNIHLLQTHALIIKTSLDSNKFIIAKLLRHSLPHSSSSNANVSYLRSLFDLVPSPDTFIFNTMVRAFLISERPHEAIGLFGQMLLLDNVKVDSFSISLVVQACGRAMDDRIGRIVHNHVTKLGFESDVFVQAALIEMYAKLGCLEISRRVLGYMEKPDSVSYNVLLAEFVRVGNISLARNLFDEMPDRDLVSWNTMVHGYASNGDVEEAQKLFDRMEKRDRVSWSSMIGAYSRMRRSDKALRLFQEMQLAKVVPDNITMVSVLSACGDLDALGMGKLAHEYIERNRIKVDMKLATSLVEMYSKCGDIDNALEVFDEMKSRDIHAWNAILLGLANHGYGTIVLEYFCKMTEEGIKPDDVTFIGLLSGCSHSCLVDEGRIYFMSMEDVYGVSPKIEHYGCMVDILARAGQLREARELIRKMPFKPDAVVWRALLGGCRIHKNIDLAEEATLNLLRLEPNVDGNYVLSSKIYSQEKKWEKVADLRRRMKQANIQKVPGSSSLEVDDSVYEFIAGDASNPESNVIDQMLEEVVHRLKQAGYRPLTFLVTEDMEEQEKERTLSHHSEKLAISFGLLRTKPGSPIRIFKNLRVCKDCHLFLKLVSEVYSRKIIVRDRNRFHHFFGGSCSCKDYW